jgi:thymidine kinase
MFSGKTTSMLTAVERRAHVPGLRCVIVQHVDDNRYPSVNGIMNHRGHEFGKVENLSASKLSDLDLNEFDVVGIDEGQFFPDIVAESDRLASLGKFVVIAYLDSTFEKKPFGSIGELVARSEIVEKLSAVCKCGRDASFNKRIAGGDCEREIGGADKYEARCRACFHTD